MFTIFYYLMFFIFIIILILIKHKLYIYELSNDRSPINLTLKILIITLMSYFL